MKKKKYNNFLLQKRRTIEQKSLNVIFSIFLRRLFLADSSLSLFLDLSYFSFSINECTFTLQKICQTLAENISNQRKLKQKRKF